MAKLVELYLNGQVADYFTDKDLSVKVFKTAYDLEQIDKKGGDYTLNLKIPRTDKNTAILGFIGDVQLSNNFSSFQLIDAEIRVDSKSCIVGRFFLDAIEPNAFKGSIIGSNISWKDLISDKNINEVVLNTYRYSAVRATNDFPFTNAVPNTIGLWDIWNADGDTYNFCMPLVSYAGNWGIDANSSAYNALIADARASQGRNYFFNSENEPLKWGVFIPAPFQRAIIRAIFENQGYSVTGDYFTKDEFKNICIPFTGESIGNVFNWGILGRVDVDYSYVGVNNGEPITLTAGSSSPNFSNYPAPGSGLPDRYVTLLNNFPILNAYTSGIFYLRLIMDDVYQFQNISTSTLTYNERYTYDYCFNDEFVSDPYLDKGYRVYKAPATGNYNVEFNIRMRIFDIQSFSPVTPYVGERRVVILLVKRNSTSFTGQDGLTLIHNDIFTTGFTNADFDPDTVGYQVFPFNYGFINHEDFNCNFNDIYCQEGENLEIVISIITVAKTGISNLTATINLENTGTISYKVYPIIDNVNIFEELQPAKFLPEISQVDFISSTLSMYNLYFNVDEYNKLVSLNTQTEYFYPNITAVDWTEKCDLREAVITAPNLYKQISWNYLEDESDQLFTETNLDPDYTRTKNSTYFVKDKEITLSFSPTATVKFTFTNGDPSEESIVYLPAMSNSDYYNLTAGQLYEETISQNYAPRILKWYGLQVLNNFTTKGFWVEDRAFVSDYLNGAGFDVYPQALFYPVVLNDNNILSYSNYLGNLGLYEKYWSKFIDILDVSIKVSLPVQLNSSDISLFNARKPVKIGSTLFFVNEIKGYDPILETRTNVILYKK